MFTEDVLLFYGERYFDIELHKEADDTGLFVSNTVNIPNGLLIFNKRYNHLFVSRRPPGVHLVNFAHKAKTAHYSKCYSR